MQQTKSRSELTQRVVCPPPLATRAEDHQIVEVFLHAYKQGRFAANPNWLRQDTENVEVIARADETTLAVEHTRIFSFEGHLEQEKVLKPIAEFLEAVQLPSGTEKKFWVRFPAKFLGKLLNRNRAHVQEELARFMCATFPTLLPRDHVPYIYDIEIPLSNRQPLRAVHLEVEVWERNFGTRTISVNGCIPSSSGLLTMVTRAIENKFPKLLRARAAVRFLMLELPDPSPGDHAVLEAICKVRPDLSSWGIDALVFALTFGFNSGNYIFFSVWDVASQTWSEYLEAKIAK